MYATRNQPISNDLLRHIAPSVFATQPYHEMSDKYAYVPTIDIVERMRGEGFEVYDAKESNTRIPGKRGFTTHVLRMRHPDAVVGKDKYGRNAEHVEVILRNSHDGGSSFELSQGVYRLVCSNGLVAGTTTASLRVPHRGDVTGQIIEGSYEIIKSSEELQSVIQDWKAITLQPEETQALALAAVDLRFADTPLHTDKAVVAKNLLKVRRYDDVSSDLWTVFNKVQENVIKGGISLGRDDKYRRVTARGIKGVDQDLKLNKALWTLADSLAKIKTGQLDPRELLTAA